MMENSQTHVRFGGVKVRKHLMTLGDNPSSQGPPLTIEWSHIESEDFSTIDAFSAEYGPSRNSSNVLYRLSGERRREILAQHNHSPQDIARVEDDIRRIQQERQNSANEPPEEQDRSIRALLQKQKIERQRKAKKKTLGFRIFSRSKRVSV